MSTNWSINFPAVSKYRINKISQTMSLVSMFVQTNPHLNDYILRGNFLNDMPLNRPHGWILRGIGVGGYRGNVDGCVDLVVLAADASSSPQSVTPYGTEDILRSVHVTWADWAVGGSSLRTSWCRNVDMPFSEGSHVSAMIGQTSMCDNAYVTLAIEEY